MTDGNYDENSRSNDKYLRGLNSALDLSPVPLFQNSPFRPRARERARQGRARRHQARTALQTQEEQLTRFDMGRKKLIKNCLLCGR